MTIGEEDTQSVIEDVLSGFIAHRDEATGTYSPVLISNRAELTMGDALREEIALSSSFDMSVAFVTVGALQSLLQDLKDHTNADDARQSHIITSTKSYFNKPAVFQELLKISRDTGIDVRVWSDSTGSEHIENADRQGVLPNSTHSLYIPPRRRKDGAAFHPKGFIFSRKTAQDGKSYFNIYVGSSNLTGHALCDQREWNLRVTSLEQGHLVNQFHTEIDRQIKESVPLTEEWIAEYEREFNLYKPVYSSQTSSELLQTSEITPNAMQQEALLNLKHLHEEGKRRAILISATGTGKTVLSALEVQSYKPKRLLYVAQQQQILEKAKLTYQHILGGNSDEFGLLTGTAKEFDRKYVFATVQTLQQEHMLNKLSSDAFDYIIVDEVHHAGAASYKRVIDHFNGANFMLGMTATPERTDGINIFELFDYNIAYEIRLQAALDQGMLCPFHYYGVAEYLGDDGARTHSRDEFVYEISQLASENRVRYIIDKIQEYSQAAVPVKGLVFCSRQEEAHRLSRLFNKHMNQQAERLYRTVAVTSTSPDGSPVTMAQRLAYVDQLERGELDYIFTVDMFNEGIDIPSLNQIVMLRNTESSIVFTQQLGRGLRKYPGKESVVIIDFIGNYTNNYLIPVALYGNTGSRSVGRKNLQRRSIGLSSISFDQIARERILRSIDQTDWSELKRLAEQYRQLRYQLGRIPLLTDVYKFDASLTYTCASKYDYYLEFVRKREQSLQREQTYNAAPAGRNSALQPQSLHILNHVEEFDELSKLESAWLKMATELLLPGVRPHELIMLAQLCGVLDSTKFNAIVDGKDIQACSQMWDPKDSCTIASIQHLVATMFPDADTRLSQVQHAAHVLDYTYLRKSNIDRFGGTPVLTCTTKTLNDGTVQEFVQLSDSFAKSMADNRTFRTFFIDTLHVGLLQCRDMWSQAPDRQQPEDYGFVYEHMYSLDEVMRLCGWIKENTPQNVGGYYLDKETNTMPIFIKYATSQYEDRLLNQEEILYYSKNGRKPSSPEFVWASKHNSNRSDWDEHHFVPVFVMRKAETISPSGKPVKGGRYYYVGHVVSFDDVVATSKPKADGSGNVNVTRCVLKLAKPLDHELYTYLISD